MSRLPFGLIVVATTALGVGAATSLGKASSYHNDCSNICPVCQDSQSAHLPSAFTNIHCISQAFSFST